MANRNILFDMRISLLVFLSMCTVLSSNQCQVTISPEVGLSYSPFKVDVIPGAVINGDNESNRLDPLIGVSGTVPIDERWDANMRFSYTWREDLKWQKYWGDIIPTFLEQEFVHDNFNIDLTANYELSKVIQMGIGASFARTINAWKSFKPIYNPDNIDNKHSIKWSKYGIHSLINVSFWHFNMKIEYTHFFYYSDGGGIANNRYNVILSIPLFSSAKRQ